MRTWVVIAIASLGCNAIFEENPAFTPDSDATTDGGGTLSDASTSTGTATAATGTTTSAAASSSSSSEGGPTECGGVDMYEPNDDEGQLAILEPTTSQDLVVIAAELATAVDEDWFKQPVDQTGAVQVQPTASIAAPEPVEVCVYIGCSVGETVIDCGAFTPITNAANTDGCCGQDMVSFTYACTGAVDLDASTYVRVTTAGPTDACVPYELTYGFAG